MKAVPQYAAGSKIVTSEAVSDVAKLAKRSFLRLPVAIDKERLVAEFNRIPADAWGVSHWDVHCSIDVLLLRGGAKGNADDFVTDEVSNNPILAQLPYISSLLAPEGPFGGAVYAFIFRTKPNGITRVHVDDDEAWVRAIRVHIPIVTNDGAFLMAEGRGKHLEVGEVWTFNNQDQHSVVNGDSTRVHMIIDVDPNPKFAELVRNGIFDPGVADPERWARSGGADVTGHPHPMVFASGEPLTIKQKQELGLNPDGFATRVTSIGKKVALLRIPLRRGDIIVAVNGVDKSAVSRTALDHIHLQHQPGETITIDVLRDGVRSEQKINLKPDYYFSPYRRATNVLKRLGIDIAKEKPAA